MGPWLVVVGVGLGVATALDMVKAWLPLGSRTKIAVVWVCAVGLVAALTGWHWRADVAEVLAAAGLAQLSHSVSAAFQARMDRDRLTVMAARPPKNP